MRVGCLIEEAATAPRGSEPRGLTSVDHSAADTELTAPQIAVRIQPVMRGALAERFGWRPPIVNAVHRNFAVHQPLRYLVCANSLTIFPGWSTQSRCPYAPIPSGKKGSSARFG